MDSHCAVNKQNNLEANDELITKNNPEEHNGEDVGDADIKQNALLPSAEAAEKGGHGCCRGRTSYNEGRGTEARRRRPDYKGPEAVNSPENVKAKPGHEASMDDRGNATEGVAPSTPVEE